MVTVVGTIPCAAPGESMIVEGRWMTHPAHGEQVQAERVERHLPDTEAEIQAYLGSGVVLRQAAVHQEHGAEDPLLPPERPQGPDLLLQVLPIVSAITMGIVSL